jgi:hypothetical protein
MIQEIEVLKILADLTIFLFSITIPTYAIAVSLLGPDYSKMVKKVEEEKACLEKELQVSAGSGPFKLEDLENKIEKFHKKEKELKSRFNPLSLYPTVVFPNVFFGLALIGIEVGIFYDITSSFIYYLAFIIASLMMGLVVLGVSLFRIQTASRTKVD